ncbi:ABC transporter permease subunit [Clostridium sp. SYSU_GA19001]|uniref:ABC transporter permease n=1 Tax=Clostridium caldaquaticum TaxID=2940653 RepID=UPI0020777855|nr:ABC transporter permease subunit [Clostridium caldaquaticum]MCM8711540.1 ABC transporter permease subunit [Clostridium caldaquaticum]
MIEATPKFKKNTAAATKLKKNAVRKYLPLYIMMIPSILYLIINNYIPMFGIVIAFKKVNFTKGILKSPWAGFSNFKYLFKTQDAWIITRNTIAYNAVFIILGTVIAITVAILLNEIASQRLKKIYQTVILLPYLISIVVVSYIVFAFLNQETGFINNTILKSLGKEGISWYSEPKYWPYILVIVNIWKSFGYSCIIYFATLVGIDKGYYEAATLDGATRWQQIKHITLPFLKPTIITLTLLSIGRIFYSDFGLFYQVPMNSGVLYNVTNTIDTYVYRGLLQLGDVGMSSAAGFYQALVGFVLVLLANFIVSKIDKDNALF